MVFQKRLDILRKNNHNFRWKYEAYEMFCCKETIKIATTLKNTKELEIFAKVDYKNQREMVPTLSNEHSNNTLACSCRLTYWYITSFNVVWMEHGALCPLVGCINYGCYASTKNRKEK